MNPDNLRKAALLADDINRVDSILKAIASIEHPEDILMTLNYIYDGQQRVFELPFTLKLNLDKILNVCRSEIISKASEL